MAYFTKHWPADLVEEVEGVVCECVSPSISICLHTLLTVLIFSLKFVECYKARNANKQDQVKHVCKVAAPPPKLGHRNINNTDLSSDDEDYLKASSTGNHLEEWNLYLTMNEVVPDEIGIWLVGGVSNVVISSPELTYFSSCMGVTTLCGNHLLATTCQSWLCLSQANELFLQLASQYASSTTTSMLILLRPYSA